MVVIGLDEGTLKAESVIQVIEFSEDFEERIGVKNVDLEKLFSKSYSISSVECNPLLGMVHLFLRENLNGEL